MADDRIDALYAEPPDGFVAARDALARELKGAGDREAAERVRRLRRPTVAAWAVNQVARRHPDELEELLDAGAELRAAHGRAAAGRRAELQDLVVRRRRLIAHLVERAGQILEEGGHPGGTRLDPVGDTLLAATVDPDAADAVREGRLERERTPPSGFGEMPTLSVAPAPQTDDPAAEDHAAQKRRARAEQHARRAEEAQDEADRLREEARHADDAVEDARRALQAAERGARRASKAAERAEQRAAKLREDAGEAP